MSDFNPQSIAPSAASALIGGNLGCVGGALGLEKEKQHTIVIVQVLTVRTQIFSKFHRRQSANANSKDKI